MTAINLTAEAAVGDAAVARRYRPEIDGLRAVAVLLVVVYHAFPRRLSGGFVGVDVFFVISGFLISGIIFDELARGAFSLKNFYMRRARRIFPALILVLAAVLAAGWLVLFPAELMRLGQQVAASAAFAANLYLYTQSGYFSPDASAYPLLHLWSLGVEEQFYIVWPILVVCLWRKPHWILPAIAGIALASFLLNLAIVNHRAAAFYFPFTRAWELMLGAALAWRAHQSPGVKRPPISPEAATVAGLALIVAAAVLLDANAPYPGWRALAPTLGAALVLWGSGAVPGVASRALASRPAVFVGLISYPLYLWHWPMLWLRRVIDPTGVDWKVTVALCAGALLLAWLTFEGVERPLRRFYRRRPQAAAVGLTAALAVVGAAGILVSIDGAPGRLPKAIQALATYKFDEVAQYREGKCHLLPDQGPLEFPPECFSDAAQAGTRIVLWGDSLATALYGGLHALSQGRFDIAELTSSACPPFVDDYQPLASRPHCAAINAFVLDHIRAAPPALVILAAAPNYDTDIAAHMRNTIAILRRSGVASVIVVGPPPIWPTPMPEAILRAYSPLKGIPANLELPLATRQSMAQFDGQLRRAAIESGALYVSAFRRLCGDDGLCVALVNDEPVVWDLFHLTLAGSTLVAADIYAAIGSAAPAPLP